MSAIAERPAPETIPKQQQEWKQQQDRQHSMDAIKSRDPCINSEASNSMEEATAAETIGTSQHQQQKGDPQQQY